MARKAPLVASDSSSSGGSDSEEEEDEKKSDIITETIGAGSGQEGLKLAVDTKKEKAALTRCERRSQVQGQGGRGREACAGQGLLPEGALVFFWPEVDLGVLIPQRNPGPRFSSWLVTF